MSKNNKLGTPVDSSGNPAVDPTENVLNLVEEAVKRINDLRTQDNDYYEKIRQADIKREDDLRIEVNDKIRQELEDHKIFNKSCNEQQISFMKTIVQERELRLAQKFDSLDKAINKADAANEKRFEGVNEFRNTLADQQRNLLPRQEYVAAHQSLSQQLGSLEKRIDKIDNLKQGGANLWILIVGIIAIAMSITTFVLGLFGK